MTALLTGTTLLSAPPAPDRSSRRPALAAQSDLDAFMEKVLARRDENWKKLQQYILDEREQIDVRGPSNIPVWGEHRDYTWYIRDGYFVRSPLKVNGVTVAEPDRRKYEDEYLRHAKAHDKRGSSGLPPSSSPLPSPERGGGGGGEGGGGAPSPAPQDVEAFITQTRQPGFIDSAYFLRFKFEPGRYALVGHETFGGGDVLRIEYYPAKLFSKAQDAQQRRQQQGKANREKDFGAVTEQMMNKISLVTVWVEPKTYQIVKYTFDNVNFDFLPAAWLLRVQDVKASMTMSEPFKDVWLPEGVQMYFSGMLAIGPFDVRYRLDYHDYKQALTSARIKSPVER
jgi:hypothetical protein